MRLVAKGGEGSGRCPPLYRRGLGIADEWQVKIDAIESAGEGRVLMRGRSVLVGRVSGMAMEDPLCQLFDLKDGRISRVQTFRSREQALEAAALRE